MPISAHKKHNTLHHYGLWSKILQRVDDSYPWMSPAIFKILDGDLIHFSYLSAKGLLLDSSDDGGGGGGSI